FFVNLDTPVNATISDSQGVGTIVNDDTQPTIAINDRSEEHREGNKTRYDFTVSLSNLNNSTITVHYPTADGTATVADNDYQSPSGTLTFLPRQISHTVTVNVNGDTTFEQPETFTVNLNTPTNATIADSQGVGTIVNDDTQPTIAIND